MWAFCLTAISLVLPILADVSIDPDVGKDMLSLVTSKGYPIEEYPVVTTDGYILGVFRIPHGRRNKPTKDQPVVYLQHGLLDSSYTFVNNFANESLAYLLADAGYDVWLGNARGNTYSKRHTKLKPNSREFWDFSYDEMGIYDLPNTADFIMQTTGAKKIYYVGHSQGTLMAWVAFNRVPEIQNKIHMWAALAPIAYVHYIQGLLKPLANIDAAGLFALFGVKQFLPGVDIINKIAPGLCNIIPQGCDDFLFPICGPTHHVNATRMPVYISETPADTSVKNMVHWTQSVNKDTFEMYDYGNAKDNMEHYNQTTPPKYSLAHITVPTILYTGSNDYLSDPKDDERLLGELNSSALVAFRNIQGYAHLDFTWGEDAATLVYKDLMDHFAKHASKEEK